MDSNIKQKWTAALRSGKIRQGKNALAKMDDSKHLRRCCLGVLCDVVGAERTRKRNAYTTYSYGGDTETDLLPHALADKVGLERYVQEDLAAMNDGDYPYEKPLSFKQIADWIDANL